MENAPHLLVRCSLIYIYLTRNHTLVSCYPIGRGIVVFDFFSLLSFLFFFLSLRWPFNLPPTRSNNFRVAPVLLLVIPPLVYSLRSTIPRKFHLNPLITPIWKFWIIELYLEREFRSFPIRSITLTLRKTVRLWKRKKKERKRRPWRCRTLLHLVASRKGESEGAIRSTLWKR